MSRSLPPLPSFARLLLLPLVTLWCGCSSGESRPEVYPATGRLTINEQPAAGALISLHPVDGQDFDARGSRPWATVQADGSFALSTYGEADGAPVGEYAVSVIWAEDPNAVDPGDRLGGRFANPRQSQWRVQIGEGPNTLEPYEIKGVRLIQPRRSSSQDSIDPPA